MLRWLSEDYSGAVLAIAIEIGRGHPWCILATGVVLRTIRRFILRTTHVL